MAAQVAYFSVAVTATASTVTIRAQDLAGFKSGLAYPFTVYASHRNGSQGEYMIATADDGTGVITVTRGLYGTAATTFAVNDGMQSNSAPQLANYVAGATSQSTPADPSGTTNTSGLMMGLAGSITPVRSGKIYISICGDMDNSANLGADAGAKAQIRYGTGAAPANAAALTGTAVGSTPAMALTGAAGLMSIRAPFELNAVVTGLTLNTAYWLDISLAAISNGTALAKNISISVIEF